MVADDSILSGSKATREMLNLAQFIVSDGIVSDLEARVFRAWLERHPELEGEGLMGRIIAQLRDIFADGHVTDEERERLGELLERATGAG
jgi:hypothetical protein